MPRGVKQQRPVPKTPANDEHPSVATVQGDDGTTFYAWRKDGRKPVIDAEQWKRNIHFALIDADFADRFGPA